MPMKKISGLIAAASVLGLGMGLLFVSTALAAGLTYSADTVVSLTSPVVTFTIKSGSTATSVVVNAGTIVVTVDGTDSFTLTSLLPVGSDINFSRTGSGVATSNTTCNLGAVTATIVASSGTSVYTITPTGVPCSTGGTSPGGGGTVTPTPTPTPTPVTTTTGTVSITSTTGGSTTTTASDQSTARLDIPVGAVTQATTFVVNPVATSTFQQEVAKLPSDKTIVGSNMFDFTASAAGVSVTLFQQAVTMTFTYTDTQIVGLDESQLQIQYYDQAQQKWVAIPSTVNTATNTITMTINHFTRFAVVAPADIVPPAAPTSITAVAQGGGAILVSWTNPTSDFRHTKIYRSTTMGQLGSVAYNEVLGTSKSDAGLTNGVTYYYTVRAVDPAGNESTNTAQVSATATGTGTVIVDGDLIRVQGTFDIFIAKFVGTKKFKRLILNPEIFNSYGHLRWDAVKDISQATVDSFTLSELVLEVNPDGSVADPKVYRVSSAPNSDTGQKQWLNMTPAAFESAGYDWDALYKINHIEAGANFYPEGTAIIS